MAKFSFMPQEEKFRDLFIASAHNMVDTAKELKDLLDSWDNIEARMERITSLEHNGDTITHQVMARLHRTFFTSFDREDIAFLSHALDDVTDFIHAAAESMTIYKVKEPTERSRELAAIILQAAQEVERAMLHLKKGNELREILRNCIEMNRLEDMADRVYRAALGELFDGRHEIADVIKWREIYEHMETATDRCEDVANILEGIAIKNE